MAQIPLGDGDMLDTAYVGAIATHVDGPEDLSALICAGRRRISVGDVADLVLVPSSSFDDAVARRPAGRALFRRGKVAVANAVPQYSGEAEFVDGAQ